MCLGSVSPHPSIRLSFFKAVTLRSSCQRHPKQVHDSCSKSSPWVEFGNKGLFIRSKHSFSSLNPNSLLFPQLSYFASPSFTRNSSYFTPTLISSLLSSTTIRTLSILLSAVSSHSLRMTRTVVRTPAKNTPTVCHVGVPKWERIPSQPPCSRIQLATCSRR